MIKKISKTSLTRLKLLTFSILLLFVSLGVLTQVPQAIDLVSSRVSFLGNIPQASAQGQVAGVQAPQEMIDSKGIVPPVFSAKGVIAEDFATGQILYQKNIHERLLPASTTKLMTALVAVDYFKVGDILTVYPDSLVGGSSMGLNVGEKLSFRSLLYGLLLNSGNDAAYTIALNYPGGLDNFVLAMNQKAQALGLTDTHFQNPAGFDDPNHYSSAYDLAKIATVASLNPQLAKIVATKQTEVSSFDSVKEHVLKNINQLLSVEGVIGIKTGYTEEAGENFVGLVDRKNHKVLTVVLDSKDRFGETKQLMDWAYNNFEWRNTY